MEDHYLESELYDLIATDRNIFSFIQDAALDGLWYWDLQNMEEEWLNKKFWVTLGYDPAKMPHKSSSWQKIIDQDDLKLAVTNVERHLKDPNYPYDQVLRFTHAQGHTVWTRCRGIAIRNSEGKPIRMLGAHTDITQAMEEKEQLERCNEQANIGYWKVDLVKDEVYWSSQVKKIIGVPEDYLPSVEKTFTFLSDESKEQLELAYQNAVRTAKPYDIILKLIRVDGEQRWVRSVGFVKTFKGEPIYAYGTWQDVHERRELEIQKEQTLKQLNSQNQRLHNFAHIVSHNLRSYVVGLKGLLGVIEDQGFDNTLDYFKYFNDSVHNLDETLRELVHIVDIEASEKADKTRICLHTEVQKVMDLLLMNAKSSNVILINNISNTIYLDVLKPYFISVLTNLITNAIKYSDPAKDSYLKVYSSLHKDDQQCEILFEDNGLGIDLEKFSNKLFSLYGTFITSDNSRGVGLYLTKNQIEQMGGSIEVDSQVGVGSTFKVFMPYS